MPTMTYELQDGATPVTVSLYKQITTLGRSPDNDICIPDPLLDEAFAQIHFDGQRFTLSTTSRKLSFSVNGRQRKQTQLKHNDQILAGSSKFIFRMFAEPREQQQSFEPLEAYRKIYTFSKLLMQDLPMEELLYGLLDQIVEVTQAERGFLIMLDEGKPHVVASRNINKESLANPEELYSDSIVAQVATQKKPLIVSDALQDTRYNQSQSVLDLQLSSVMCVPMLEKGALLGVIYVGNSRVRALFDRQALEVLTIFASQASMIVQKAMTMEGLQLKNKTLLEALQSRRESEILGTCDAIREVLRKIHKVATTDISVLVTGETGTGKELVARELHRLSPRHGKPFVTINCGAIPENLLESELFGHVRGAFTGAIRDKIGKFQAADGGTLFLDELGEMPINLQVKLLRALEEKKIIRVGSHAPEDVDIRIVAATNRKLEEEVEAGRFREDLYYRLNVINIHLPPLRTRGEDLVLLAKYFLHQFAQQYDALGKQFAAETLSAIKQYPWPGNIRELRNRVQKALILSERSQISMEDLDIPSSALTPILSLADAKERFQSQYINQILDLHAGNRTQTAKALGVDPRTIFRHLEKEQEKERQAQDPYEP